MKIFIIIYLLLIHSFVAITLIKTDISSKIYNKLSFNTPDTEITPYYNQLLSFQARIDKNTQDNSVFFIGDSLIQGLAVSTIHSKAINFGIGGDTSLGVIQRIPQYTSLSQARLVVISVGINDLDYRKNQQILTNYNKITQLIPPNTPILFSAVLPVNEALVKHEKLNKRIQQLNRMLYTQCKNNDRLHFINITSALTDSTGNLLNRYDIGDGLHLNAIGNTIWIEALKSGIEKITFADKN